MAQMQEGWVVDVPNVGEVEFPSSMTQDQVSAAVKQLHDEHPLTKASAGMLPQSRVDEPGYQPGLADSAVGFIQGAGERIGETVEGLARLPGVIYDDPGGFVKNLPGNIVEGMKETGSNLVSGNARRMGSAATDVVGLLQPAAAEGRVLARGVGAVQKIEPIVHAMNKAGSQGGVMSVANSMRGWVADTLDPPRMPQGFDPYMPNTPSGAAPGVPRQTSRVPYGMPEPVGPPNPNAGGRFFPGGRSGRTSPGIISVDNAMQEALGELRPMPSHPSPGPTPARVADPGNATRPPTTNPLERQEAIQRDYRNTEAANAYEQGGRVNRSMQGPVEATFLGYQDVPGGQPIPLFNVKGGRFDGSTVTLGTLEAEGIAPPTTKAAPVATAPEATPTPVADATTPAATTPDLPPGSKSKGATKMSTNDMEVFSKAVQSGMSVPDATAEMLKQRAARHATKYGDAKAAKVERLAQGDTIERWLDEMMKRGSH